MSSQTSHAEKETLNRYSLMTFILQKPIDYLVIQLSTTFTEYWGILVLDNCFHHELGLRKNTVISFYLYFLKSF